MMLALLLMSALVTDHHSTCVDELVAAQQYEAAWDEATKAYTRASEQQDSETMARAAFSLGLIAQRSDMPESSIAAYTEALDLGLASTGVRYNLALTFLTTGERAAALQFLDQALAQATGGPDAPLVLHTYANALVRDGATAAARQLLEKYVLTVELTPVTREHLLALWLAAGPPPVAVDYVVYLVETRNSVLALDVALRLLPHANGDTRQRLIAAALLALAHTPDPIVVAQRDRRMEQLLATLNAMPASTRGTIAAILSSTTIETAVIEEWPCSPLLFHHEPLGCAQAVRRLALRLAEVALAADDTQRAESLLRLATFGTVAPCDGCVAAIEPTALFGLIESHVREDKLHEIAPIVGDYLRPIVSDYLRSTNPALARRNKQVTPTPLRHAGISAFTQRLATLMAFIGLWTQHQTGSRHPELAARTNVLLAKHLQPAWTAEDAPFAALASTAAAADGAWKEAQEDGIRAIALLQETGQHPEATALQTRLHRLAALAPHKPRKEADHFRGEAIPEPSPQPPTLANDCFVMNLLVNADEDRSEKTDAPSVSMGWHAFLPDRSTPQVTHRTGDPDVRAKDLVPLAYRFPIQRPTRLLATDLPRLEDQWQPYTTSALRQHTAVRMTNAPGGFIYRAMVPLVVGVCVNLRDLEAIATPKEIERALYDAIVTVADVRFPSTGGMVSDHRAINTYVGEDRSVMVLTSVEEQHYVAFQPRAWLPRNATDETPPIITW